MFKKFTNVKVYLKVTSCHYVIWPRNTENSSVHQTATYLIIQTQVTSKARRNRQKKKKNNGLLI